MAHQVVVFRLGSEKFAADIASVKEIVRLAPISSLPQMPPYVDGVINLRGKVTMIVDLRRRLGVATADHTKDSRIIVLSTDDSQMGAIVDAVTETLTITDESIDTSSGSITSISSDHIEGIARVESGLVILVDLKAILFGNAGNTDDSAGVSDWQRELVQASFAKVETIADDAAKLFYGRLFELDPDVKPLFKGVKMAEQRTKLMQTLAIAVKGLDRIDEIASAIQQLGVRHLDYGVTAAHYGTVGEALLWTLEQGLGPDFTDEVRGAWTAVYGLLSSVMIAAAEEAAEDAAVEAVATA